MVAMDEELIRVESAVTATACGDLTWERWPLDVVTALGLSGVRNPLGFAVVRYLNDEPCAARVWDVHIHLVTELIRRGVAADIAGDAAKEAIGFWNDRRCRKCEGRGINTAGVTCSHCHGTGHQSIPDSPATLNLAISCLVEAEQWMERQLLARLKRG